MKRDSGTVVAFLAGASWEAGWITFAGTAVLGVMLNALVLPAGQHNSRGAQSGENQPRSSAFRWFARRESVPLFTVALTFGVISAFYYAFAVDFVSRSGGFPGSQGHCFSSSWVSLVLSSSLRKI